MADFNVSATVTAKVQAESRGEAMQALCDRLPDIDRYTVHDLRVSCGTCDGSGFIHFMNMHPEDYEPPKPCPACNEGGK